MADETKKKEVSGLELLRQPATFALAQYLNDLHSGIGFQAYRRRIRCKKILAVPGNHDKIARKLKDEFSWLDNLAEVSVHGQPIVLCHYALRVWNRSNRGSWHLYGHSHGRLPEMPTSLSMDVGIDTHEFRPWHYDEIAGVMEKKSEAQKEGRT